MTKKERAAYVLRRLCELYPDPPVPLHHSDEYTLLIAVLLSAQCTDKKVNEITPLLFAKAKTPHEMIKLTPDAIRQIIRPCGLSPAKSRAIHGLSEILLSEHQGKVPNTLEDLENLPGVGHKTAQVVMAQAFNVPSFPVDTHIQRLAWRWGLSEGTSGVPSVDKVERDLKALFPPTTWNKLHLQIIYYGREHCSARGCDGTVCEICRTLFPGRKPLQKNTKTPSAKKSSKAQSLKSTTRTVAKSKSSKPSSTKKSAPKTRASSAKKPARGAKNEPKRTA